MKWVTTRALTGKKTSVKTSMKLVVSTGFKAVLWW